MWIFELSDAESKIFHRVPKQVLYQAEPLPDFIRAPYITSAPRDAITIIIAFATHRSLRNSAGQIPSSSAESRRLLRTKQVLPSSAGIRCLDAAEALSIGRRW
jgi:hypothetical protein